MSSTTTTTLDDTIEARAKKVIASQFGVKFEDIKNDASIVDDLGSDSLDTIELLMALEEEFELEISDEEAERLDTVQKILDYLASHVKTGD